MKLIKYITLLVLFAIASIAGTYAQTDIISAKEFKGLMKSNKELVVIDASKSKVYKKAHIKNAQHILYGDLNLDKATNPIGMIQNSNSIADYFGKLGITENSEIVIYDGGTQKYSSRLYFVLKYVGANNVKLTHKDDKQWQKNRMKLTSAAPVKLKAATFTPMAHPEMMVDLDYVMANKDKDNVVLIDNRTAKEFIGDKKVVDEKFGHIPAAVNIPYEEFELDGGAYKNAEQLQALADKYGLTPDKELIFHCKTGVKGAVAYIAFKNILGRENVKLYDGGCAEFCSKYDLVK